MTAPRPVRTVGKTPAMAFVLDYLREFPGAKYRLVKKAALSHGLPAPAPVIYGNALRVLRTEASHAPDPRPRPARGRRRGGAVRGLRDLAGLADQMRDVVAERDRLRQAIANVAAVIRALRWG